MGGAGAPERAGGGSRLARARGQRELIGGERPRGLGRGEGAVPLEGPLAIPPQPALLRVPLTGVLPWVRPRCPGTGSCRHRERSRGLSPHRAAAWGPGQPLLPRGRATATPRAGTALSGPVLVRATAPLPLGELSAPREAPVAPALAPADRCPHTLRSRRCLVVPSQVRSRGCSLSRRR